MNELTHSDIDILIEDLRLMQAWCDAHPEVEVWRSGTHGYVSTYPTGPDGIGHDITAPEVASVVRKMSKGQPLGKVRKESTENTMSYILPFGAGRVTLSLQVHRKTVCVAKVVGTKTVERTDPEAPKITVEEDVIEWECLPVLAEAEVAS